MATSMRTVGALVAAVLLLTPCPGDARAWLDSDDMVTASSGDAEWNRS